MDNHKKAALIYLLAAAIPIFTGWVVNPVFAAMVYVLITLAIKEVVQ